ncbi:hypothetical protein [Streptomyces sp. CH6]|uniref:hypothetical protein n=1 Tax=unclassified Streptomyces TaxID=2593676 RepID=UPI003D045B2C
MHRIITLAAESGIRAALLAGRSNAEIARSFKVHPGTVARRRAALGLPTASLSPSPLRNPLTLAEAWQRHVEDDGDGHLVWTGIRVPSRPGAAGGTPILTYRGREHSARAVAFQVRTGRAPVGSVLAECGRRECVAPAHVEDRPGRSRLRAQLAALMGTESTLAECTRGHDAATSRRYLPDGHPYCVTCADLMRAHRKAKAA